METKVNRKILTLAARLRYLARARMAANECLKDIRSALDGTGAGLHMDFYDYEKRLRETLSGYLTDVEKYLKREFKL